MREPTQFIYQISRHPPLPGHRSTTKLSGLPCRLTGVLSGYWLIHVSRGGLCHFLAWQRSLCILSMIAWWFREGKDPHIAPKAELPWRVTLTCVRWQSHWNWSWLSSTVDPSGNLRCTSGTLVGFGRCKIFHGRQLSVDRASRGGRWRGVVEGKGKKTGRLRPICKDSAIPGLARL